MPTRRCVKNGKKGWCYGSKGPYPTKKKADEVGAAIRWRKYGKK